MSNIVNVIDDVDGNDYVDDVDDNGVDNIYDMTMLMTTKILMTLMALTMTLTTCGRRGGR